jgi:hypothetical protein
MRMKHILMIPTLKVMVWMIDRRSSSTAVKTQSSSVLGVLPVALNGVTSGKLFLFEKLLVC